MDRNVRQRAVQLLSSYNPPWMVGLVDGVLVMLLMFLSSVGVTAVLNLLASDSTAYVVNYAALLMSVVVTGAVVGVLSIIVAIGLQARPYLVRSMSRTIWFTVACVLVSGTLVWGGFSVYYEHLLGFANWVQMVVFFGPIAAFLGYRVLGFTDPNGVTKLLREGRTAEAHAIMAAAAAARGLTWIPGDDVR